MRTRSVCCLLLLCLATALPSANAQLLVDLEMGYVVNTGYADVRTDAGTSTDLATRPGLDNPLTFRGRFGYTAADKHNLWVLIAPLTLEGSGTLDAPYNFADRNFAPGTPLEYQLDVDQYRIGYRYDLAKAEQRLRFGIGATGNLRVLRAQVIDPAGGATRRNTSFQPLLNLYLSYAIAGPEGPTGPRLRLLLDAEGMATGSWRTADIFAGLRWQLGRYGALRGGYRLLNTSTDTDEFHADILTHSANLALIIRIGGE